MATRMVRPLSLRFSIPEELYASAETVLQGLESCLAGGSIDYLPKQLTGSSIYIDTKDRLLTHGFHVKGTYVSCVPIDPDVVFVTVKMPFEMAYKYNLVYIRDSDQC